MTPVSGSLFRLAIHPEGWFAGARAAFATATVLLAGLVTFAGGLAWRHELVVVLGVLLVAGAVAVGVTLAYAAASADRRRSGPRTAPQPPAVDPNDVLTLVFERIDRMEDRLMNVIREGREAHTREHEQAALACKVAMGPLQSDFDARQQAKRDTQARIGPIKAVFVWATDHWQVTVAILGLIGALLFALGWVHPNPAHP
jgi:hypothetical protein